MAGKAPRPNTLGHRDGRRQRSKAARRWRPAPIPTPATENPGRSWSPRQGPGQLTKSETATEVRSLEPFPGRRQARGGAAYLPPGPGRAWGSPVALRRLRPSGAELGTVGKPPAGKATAEGKKAWVRRQNAPQYLHKAPPTARWHRPLGRKGGRTLMRPQGAVRSGISWNPASRLIASSLTTERGNSVVSPTS